MAISRTLLLATAAAAVLLPFATARTYRGDNSLPVCIVGAGPSGLTAAKALEDKGREVVVFEKRATVGGKCQSYYNKYNISPRTSFAVYGDASLAFGTLELTCVPRERRGRYYPLGAVLFTNSDGYADTYDLVQRTGVPFEPFESIPQWTYDPNTGSTELSITTTEEVLELQAELARYTELWKSLFSVFAVPAYQVR